MNKLYNPDNIDRFSDCLVRAVENQEAQNIESLLLVLQILVNGTPGERCQGFYNQKMPPDRCIAAVLRAKSTQEALRIDTGKCEKLIDLLLGLPYLTFQLCRALSTLIACSSSSNMKKNFAVRILGHEDLYKFDLKVIRHCLEQDTAELEMAMVKLCSPNVSGEDFFKLFDHWIRWCSQSPEVFQVVSGIWNELLRHMKCKRQVLAAVTLFVTELRKACCVNGVDFVSLYPYEAQSLICLLEVDVASLKKEGDVEYRTILRTVQNEYDRICRTDPYLALLLSTHFPLWNEFLV